MAAHPPRIFSPERRDAVRRRMSAVQRNPDAPRYLFADVAEDVAERLAFLRHVPRRALVLGDAGNLVADAVTSAGAVVTSADITSGIAAEAFNAEEPWPSGGYDLVVCTFALDAANDLPGALIHARRALAQGGLALVTMLGAGSLPRLREIMAAADADRPSPRIHPQVDVRAAAQLLQRTGYADPVADARPLDVRFSSLATMLADLRAQGLTSVLRQGGAPLGKAARVRAQARFDELAGPDGRVTERFELLTLSGWQRTAPPA